MTEVSMILQYQYAHREGHLDDIYRIFWYLQCSLKKKDHGRIVFDASVPRVDDGLFNPTIIEEWWDFYPEAEEIIPHDKPIPRG